MNNVMTKPTPRKPTAKEIESKRLELMQDERATARYWNGDDWGSISGTRDAAEWVKSELEKFERGD